MAWTTPLTAVANAALTAAQWNLSVRDNLAETAPAKATTAGRIFVATGTNGIAERAISQNIVETQETTTSTAYVDLTTAGPAVTAATGTQALMWLSAYLDSSVSTAHAAAGYAISGATTASAADEKAVRSVSGLMRASALDYVTGLTAGSNTFTAKYRSSGITNTATFANRRIGVMAL
jgi:hypothetical protein